MEHIAEESMETIMTPHGTSSKAVVTNDDTIVGFDQEVDTLKDRLTADLSKQVEVISIVGMAGLGKTTLARKLYNDPLIMHHFYIRGWSYASQGYQKEAFLRRLLSSITLKKNESKTTSDDKLGERLYRHLKGNRYLIVIDDIWNFSDWDDLRKLFPNDNNGSRILFTTRIKEVAFCAEPEKPPHFLRFLTKNESWFLLQQKVFRGGSCPHELVETGKTIADYCHGLPLTIVVLGGLLAKKEKKKEWWKKVAEHVTSFVVGDTEHCLSTLDLSYDHLPEHLKPCFLYLGAFPEDYEIPIRKLKWLWIAEGFIEQDVNKSLEEVAEEYLLDLVNRSLLMIVKRKSTGESSACRVHDLLRDFCLCKAKKGNFLASDLCLRKSEEEEETDPDWDYDIEEFSFPSWQRYKQRYPFLHSCCLKLSHCLGFRNNKKNKYLLHNQEVELVSRIPESSNHYRLSVHSRVFDHHSFKPFASHIQSFLCFSIKHSLLVPKEKLPSMFEEFKHLKVLDLSTLSIPTFPSKITQLTLLRYLALRGKYLSPPASISNLCNLQTLALSETTGIYIIQDIWKMVNLRHLYISGKNHVLKFAEDDCFVMGNLQTLSQVNPSRECQALLAKTPYLRKLGFCGKFTSKGKFWLPDIGFLNNLESLKLFNMTAAQIWNGSYWNIRLKACCRNDLRCNIHPGRLEKVSFPQNLKRLTLSCTYLYWSEISTIGMLPNLEALKLEYLACYGPRWETSEGGFLQLKYLRLKCMDIEEWETSQSHFPILQRLVLHGCEKLEEIPLELGDIPTLQSIEVSWCSRSAVISASKIQQEQQSYGNDLLQSKDDDIGYHNITKGKDLHWSFKAALWETLFFCHFWWHSKQAIFDVFSFNVEAGCSNLGGRITIKQCNWRVRPDGFYFQDFTNFTSGVWFLKHQWNNSATL